MAELARVAGAPGGDAGSDESRAQAFIDWLAALKREIGIPATLADVRGPRAIVHSDVPALVAVAEKDTTHQTNPRPCTAADFERMFASALGR
jgi:alcohol dehydrogenase class IV